MPTLPNTALGTYVNVSNTAIQGSDPVLEYITEAEPPDDTDYVYDATNSTHEGSCYFSLGDMPTDFVTMKTCTINLRYAWQSGTQTNAWTTLRARIYKSDGTTALTDKTDIASSITTTTLTNSGAISFTGVDTAATKADWDGARVYIYFNITKSKSGDTLRKMVSGAEVKGTYNVFAGMTTQSYTLTGKDLTSLKVARTFAATKQEFTIGAKDLTALTVDRNKFPGLGQLLLTGFAATIIATINVLATPGVGEINVTGYAPTIVCENNIVITPGVGQLIINGYKSDIDDTFNTGWGIPTESGAEQWTGPDNAFTNDESYATLDYKDIEYVNFNVQLYYNDNVIGNSKVEECRLSEDVSAFGGSTDLWGSSLSSSQVNNPDFRISITLDDGLGSYSTALLLGDFDFTLPEDCEITGYKVEVEYYSDGDYCYVDFARVKVCYTLVPVDVTTGLGQLSLNGFAPATLTSNHKNVIPGLGELLSSGYTPIIGISDNKNIQPDVSSLVLIGFIPVIGNPNNQFVNPDIGELSLTGYIPIVVATNNIFTSPDVGELLLAGYIPTIGITNHKYISPGLGELVLTGYVPIISATADKVAYPDVGEISLTGFSPSVVTTANITVQPGVGEVLLAGFGSSIVLSDNIIASPGVGLLALSGFSPTVNTTVHIEVLPLTGQILLSGYSPSVEIPTDKIAYPGVGSLILTGYAPTVLRQVLMSRWTGTVWESVGTIKILT